MIGVRDFKKLLMFRMNRNKSNWMRKNRLLSKMKTKRFNLIMRKMKSQKRWEDKRLMFNKKKKLTK